MDSLSERKSSLLSSFKQSSIHSRGKLNLSHKVVRLKELTELKNKDYQNMESLALSLSPDSNQNHDLTISFPSPQESPSISPSNSLSDSSSEGRSDFSNSNFKNGSKKYRNSEKIRKKLKISLRKHRKKDMKEGNSNIKDVNLQISRNKHFDRNVKLS